MRGPHYRRRSAPLLLAAVALWAGLAAAAAAQGNAADRPRGARGALRRNRRPGLDRQHQLENVGADRPPWFGVSPTGTPPATGHRG